MRDGSVACYTKLVAVDTNTGCWNIVFHFLTWDVSFAHAVAHLAPPRRYVQLQECCGREQRYLPSVVTIVMQMHHSVTVYIHGPYIFLSCCALMYPEDVDTGFSKAVQPSTKLRASASLSDIHPFIGYIPLYVED